MQIDKNLVQGLRGAVSYGISRFKTRGRTVSTGPVFHRAGPPVPLRQRMMSGFLTVSALISAAGFGVTVMAPPTPYAKTTGTGKPGLIETLSPTENPAVIASLSSEQWSHSALGVDSGAHETLLKDPYRLMIEIAPGDTLMSVLLNAGLDQPTSYALVESLSTAFDPLHLRPKQTMEVSLLPTLAGGPSHVTELRFHPDNLRSITVRETETGYLAAEDKRDLSDHVVRTDGTIDSSLYVAARDAGVPLQVLGSLINIFSFDVDFQREIQQGDRFSLMFNERRTDDGEPVDFGDIVLAEMTVGGTVKRFYRFEDDTGRADYYDSKGQSVRRALLRTPIEGARISSGFGNRKHPILGYNKMHRGVDFAAPTGTPIFAAGDGVVEVAGWNGGYGRYVRIRHNGTYKTAYAHLSRIDSRIKPGARVDQRQIIGYVGTSGQSTGPHLHYEVHVNGSQTNPRGVKLPTGKTLKGGELARFERIRAAAESQYAAIESRTQVAQATD